MKNPFTFGIDPATGSPAIFPAFKAADENLVLKNLMELLEKFSQKRKIVIALDEFQEVSSICFLPCFSPRAGHFTSRRQAIRLMRLKQSIIFPG